MSSDAGTTMQSSFWSTYNLVESPATKLVLGPLRIWLERVENEIRMAYKCSGSGEEEVSSSATPEDETWRRWALKYPVRSLQLLPCFPDKPVVVKPDADSNNASMGWEKVPANR